MFHWIPSASFPAATPRFVSSVDGGCRSFHILEMRSIVCHFVLGRPLGLLFGWSAVSLRCGLQSLDRLPTRFLFDFPSRQLIQVNVMVLAIPMSA
jgi:hypothetical protein